MKSTELSHLRCNDHSLRDGEKMKNIRNIMTKNVCLWFAIVSVLFVVNYIFKFSLHTNVRTLYLDDLKIYSNFKEGTFLDAIFLNLSNKIRPVAHMVLYIAFWIADANFQKLDIFILLWNLVIALGVTSAAYQLIGGKTGTDLKAGLALIVGVLYSISRFSYYVWTEVFGLMESTALLLAIGILLMSIKYLFDTSERNLYIAGILYVMVIFTHERYILLAGVIFIAIFLKHGMKKPLKYLIPILTFILFMGIRIIMFGNRFVDGTGGTSVIDTFNLKDTLLYMICQILYLFGINAGPAYLNGINFYSVSWQISILTIIQIIFLLVCFSSYLLLMIKDHDIEELKKSVIYVVFIFCCIVSSSITIRVEMRWIYVSYTAFLIYMAQIFTYLVQRFDIKKFIIPGIIYIVIGFICEEYYQSYYKNLYYWDDRLLTSSLYEKTLVKYGEDFFSRNVYIIGNSMKWTMAEWNQFYSQFFKEDTIFPNVIYVEHVEELYKELPVDKQPIILLEDLSNCQYIDVSEIFY